MKKARQQKTHYRFGAEGGIIEGDGEHFVDKAAYFNSVQKMLENNYVDTEKYIEMLEPIFPGNSYSQSSKQRESPTWKSYQSGLKSTWYINSRIRRTKAP